MPLEVGVLLLSNPQSTAGPRDLGGYQGTLACPPDARRGERTVLLYKKLALQTVESLVCKFKFSLEENVIQFRCLFILSGPKE